MSEQGIVGRADLQKKDKGELQAIVDALGGKASSRLKKADLVDQILELSGVVPAAETAGETAVSGDTATSDESSDDVESPAEAASSADSSTSPSADSESQGSSGSESGSGSDDESDSPADSDSGPRQSKDSSRPQPRQQKSRSGSQGGQNGDKSSKRQRPRRGRGGEPPAEWETELSSDSRPDSSKRDSQKHGSSKQDGSSKQGRGSKQDGSKQDSSKQDGSKQDSSKQDGSKQDSSKQDSVRNQGGQNQGSQNQGGADDDGDNNRRRRRRGRNRDRDDEVANLEPVAVSGYMELRDDGYGFLRVNGWMPSKDDVYVPVRMVRQWGLRKGDHVVGTARPANRNEKNPAMEVIETVNGLNLDDSKNRPLFEDLTPLFPDERLRLEQTRSPLQITPRIIDLVAPIGKGQRGLIVSPPKAGKTSIMKDIARSIEKNNPEVHLVVLLIDERPEEVTDMARSLDHGEVVASTFDRPPEEHCALAELTIERAKRMVEAGEDVVILLDGITRLARAYNMAGPSSGRLMSGGLDTAAIYPPKRFFGAARNLEEGGSLTILATALVETGSRMDEVIFEEFKGTGNMELRLDRRLAERGVFPAINIDGSSTRRPELLSERTERLQVEKLRRVLGALADSDAAPSAGIDLLVDRLKSFKTNKDFLAEIAKS